MKPYLDLLRHVLDAGTPKSDRTGTGTLSVFGPQLRFDLADGFPLVTTKAMFLSGVVEELLWFISGSTDVRDLQRRGVRFWDPWMDEDGTIGPGYGRQLRCVEHIARVKPRLYDPVASTVSNATVFGVGTLGTYDEADPDLGMLQATWREMIRRCYHVSARAYEGYGGKGVHVDPAWHVFAQFQRDAKRLPNWTLKREWPDEYSLDKDVLHASNRYGPRTCMWASQEVQSANTSTNAYFEAVDPNGARQAFTSIGEANRIHGLNVSAVHRCLNGKLRTHHGWSDFSYLDPGNGDVFRYTKVDPLKAIVASLKHDPDSRRHVISLWNPHEIDRMMLPPCHGVVIQFNVDRGRLNCLMYQRSGDLFLGVPVNIASYALLTHLLAQVVGLEPGVFTWQAGDAHIYSNHVDQVRTQLARAPRPLPRLVLNPEKRDLFAFRFEDIAFKGYESWPAIRAPVAV